MMFSTSTSSRTSSSPDQMKTRNRWQTECWLKAIRITFCRSSIFIRVDATLTPILHVRSREDRNFFRSRVDADRSNATELIQNLKKKTVTQNSMQNSEYPSTRKWKYLQKFVSAPRRHVRIKMVGNDARSLSRTILEVRQQWPKQSVHDTSVQRPVHVNPRVKLDRQLLRFAENTTRN